MVEVAYLGPEGTYTHQAAHQLCRASDANPITFIPRPTITHLLSHISPTSPPLAVVPLENSTYGPVSETYDALRHERFGKSAFVRGEYVMGIAHCVVTRSGEFGDLKDVRTVGSHMQALGQCVEYIKRRMPNAKTVSVGSTALAARLVLGGVDGDASSDGEESRSSEPSQQEQQFDAAICSEICAELYPGLEIRERSVQDGETNHTRFLLLHTYLSAALPIDSPPKLLYRALLRLVLPLPFPLPVLSSDSDSDSNVSSPLRRVTLMDTLHTLTHPLQTEELEITRVDRRPALDSIPFRDVFFVEVAYNGHVGIDGDAWLKMVQSSVDRIKDLFQQSRHKDEDWEALCIGWW